ncbi:hypothetical protein CHS0354_034205 [Potamilus streckersoni]|uniref:Uncharacterized protein n=1 Tax=Potamilus streckersoni TaxID=2493646 RepID=A0AAE0T2V3_9BIVA|nr:hypothetical protein CHS0354_034205 [Potamilus streckersoni]
MEKESIREYSDTFMESSRPISKASVKAEDIRQQYTECQSCLKEYNDNDVVPRILPCLHACCHACIVSMENHGTMKCPVCEVRHTVPDSDLDQFRKDDTRKYLIMHLKVQRGSQDIACEECSKQKKAVSRCHECGQFLCTECADIHSKTKVTKKHKMVTLTELKESPFEEFQSKQTCEISGHEDQTYAFYCKKCDRPVCALCAIQSHPDSQGHNIKQINDVYVEVKRVVEGLMSDVKHRTLSAKDTITAIDNTVDGLDSALKKITKEIDNAFDECVKALDRRRDELKDKLHTKVKEKKKILDKQLDSICFHKNNMEDSYEFSNNMANYSTNSEFLFFKDRIIHRLNELREEDFDIVPHDNDEIKFKPVKMGEDFNKLSRELGSIWSTSAYLPNTHVEPFDISMDREQVFMKITLFDSEGHQQSEGEVDIRVEVTDPNGRTHGATIIDCTATEGLFKAKYRGTAKGKHRATVFVMGTMIPNEFSFHVGSGPMVERLDLEMDMEKREHMELDYPMKTATPSEASQAMTPITDFMLGDIVCPDFVFDAVTCHNTIDILEEGKTVRAKTSRTKGKVTTRLEPGRLQIYRGAMASRPMHKTGLYYWEVGVVYKIQRLIRQGMLFEFGLAKLDCIDKHQSVDCHPAAWSVSARGCHVCGKICLQTWHNGQLLTHKALSPRTPSPPGTFIRQYYGFMLDIEKKHWIIVDVKNKKMLFHFKNLVISEMSEPLWPVFGVYSPENVSVTITLKTGRAIDSIPEEALENLVA